VRSWKTLPGSFEEQMAAYADKVSEEYGLAALFLCMQPQIDLDITRRIMRKMKAPAYLAEGELTVNEVLGVCEQCRFMVAMRLHAAIYAVKQAKPVIGLIYDPKVKGVLAEVGRCWFAEVENVNSKLLLDFTREIMKNGVVEEDVEVEGLVAKNVEIAAGLINNLPNPS
jgi:polysaccharide pyruvyl transferase WcaK-like protein